MPRRGYRTQPRVSTLGIIHQERRALKGRQIERLKMETGSNGPIVETSQLRTRTSRGNRGQLHLVPHLPPFQGRTDYYEDSKG